MNMSIFKKIVWSNQKKLLSDLIPATYNPRKISQEQAQQLKKSLDKFQLADPIIINADSKIIGGHQRYHILKQVGETEVDVRVPDRQLTEDEEKELNLRLNKNTGEFDLDLLKDLGKDVLTEVGFTSQELDAIFPVVVDPQDDVVPEPPEEPIAKRGDIWLLGQHRVMCGDSTIIDDVERLMDGKKADMVFTDPPYGIAFEDEKGNSIKNDDLNDEKLADFNRLWQESANVASKGDCFLLAWQSPRKFHLLDYFGAWTFFRLITMYKSNRISFPHGAWINKTEPCCVFAKGQPRITKQEYMDDCFVYKHDKESHEDSNVGHPTPKPVKMVMSNIQACVKKDDIVLDIFLGSGSTLIACEKTNRICYGMELDPKYVDVIIKRWEDYTGKKAELLGPERN